VESGVGERLAVGDEFAITLKGTLTFSRIAADTRARSREKVSVPFKRPLYQV
jgi:hypothetical protein